MSTTSITSFTTTPRRHLRRFADPHVYREHEGGCESTTRRDLGKLPCGAFASVRNTTGCPRDHRCTGRAGVGDWIVALAAPSKVTILPERTSMLQLIVE
jgi:hypothetical protein